MKRVFALLLSFSVLFTLAACGSKASTEIASHGDTQIIPTDVPDMTDSPETVLQGELQKILDEADSRRQMILNNRSDVTASGTTYYISNSGDDANDGLSPETAWATLDRAFETFWPLSRNFLKPGDAVLLERGGVWYVSPDDRWGLTSDAYNIVEGVTLGAYGEGARPVIRGDIPQANESDFWTPFYDGNGIKIWASAEKLQDSNVIVFNGGEAIAEEIMPLWSKTLNGYCDASGAPFDVTHTLSENLTFCLPLDMAEYSEGQDLSNPVQGGTLYLRCDEGNPADVYREVSIPQAQTGLGLHRDAGIVGVDIRYFTCIAVEMSGYEEGHRHQTVYDCEISYCGGLLHNYQYIDELPEGVLRPYCGGGALQVSGSENTVKNCYIHHCGPMTLICTVHVDDPVLRLIEHSTYTGNLIEYCGTAMHIADLAKMDNPDAEGFISNLVFSDNMVMHNGYGWVENHLLQMSGKYSNFYSVVENDMGAANNDGIFIRDNVFYLSPSNLLCLVDHLWNSETKVNQPMVFSGNTYIQYQDGLLGVWNWERGWAVGDPSNENDFLKAIGDDSGVVINALNSK